MSGEITVESQVGKGTTFKMFINIGIRNPNFKEQDLKLNSI